MLDVREQLRGYGEQLDLEMTPVRLDEIPSPVGRTREPPLRRPTRQRPWPGWVYAVAAAVAVLVVVGGTAWLLSGGDTTGPPATAPLAPTLPATEPPQPTYPDGVVPSLGAAGWWPVADPAVFGETTLIEGVVAGGFGFVAVGERLDPEGTTIELAVWVSEDGEDWEPVDDGTLPEHSEARQETWRLEAGPVGLVLWSWSDPEEGPASVLYFSEDGRNWAEATTPQPTIIRALSSSERGFLAVGEQDNETVILGSEDGLVWIRLATEFSASVFRIEGVTSWDTRWLAWGWECEGETRCDRLWVSDDGVSWDRIEMNPTGSINLWYVFDIASYRGDLYAVGEVVVDGFGETPAIWASGDGRDWEQVLDDPSRPGIVSGITTSAEMAVALSSHSVEELDHPDEIWMSIDGRHWTLIGTEEDFASPSLRQLAVADGRVVAGGVQDWNVWPPEPALWTWTGNE